MNRKKLFLENFFVYGLGGMIGKIIPVIAIPIIARLMPDSSYIGINDMAFSLTSFIGCICRLGFYEALFRLFFECDEHQYHLDICYTTLTSTGISAIIGAIIVLAFRKLLAFYFLGDVGAESIIYFVAITIVVDVTNMIISAPTRIQNDRKTYLLMNMLSPAISYLAAIPLLLNGYYLFALPISSLLSGLTTELLFYLKNRKWFRGGKFDKMMFGELVKIGIPCIPSFLIYWVFNSSDRVMITNFMGTSATGLYSVGSKLGLASQLVYMAFSGGWQYFTFSTMKNPDQVKNNSMIYEAFAIVSFCGAMIICSISYPIYSMLFIGDYVDSYIVAPYLFLAPLLQMLFQVAGTQFSIIKKTWPNSIFLGVGAVLNIVLNLKLIPILGIEGAAIASLVGYIVSDAIQLIILTKMKLMYISSELIVMSLWIVIYYVVWRTVCAGLISRCLIWTIIGLIVSIIVYRKTLTSMIKNRFINK